ncbi:thiamine phosphate synthase [Mucilaginibacter antarcticus]|uniref:Thiamine-phosphate synthase n=1 Tax=Mucilaginibacter antarcticus TaxID=1855725 RepID=A0ABW5XNY4_9SPHI
MKKYISKFHYLTQDLTDRSHIEQAQMACEAGANWIQYRCLTKTDEELIAEINELAIICDDWGSTLIITNHYHLLDKVDVQGVHIEDMDTDLASIRATIGEDKTLGASATNIKSLLSLQALAVADYCGYGPFAHTETKLNDKPLLGLEGYELLQRHRVEIPLIAIGGIQISDVELLMKTGIYGVAVSSAVNKSDDPASAVKTIYKKIY